MEIETDLKQVRCALADTQTRLDEQRAVVSALRAAGISRAPIEAEPVGIQCSASTIEALRGLAKEKDPAIRAQIFAKEIRPIIASGRGNDVLRIIDSNVEVLASNSLGTLTGNLIAQRALDLLRVKFPILGRVTKDYSNESAKMNQTIDTRVIGSPSVGTYDPSVGFVPSAAADTDVPVTISQHAYCQIQYNANELASTNRDLFGETAGAVAYAMGLNFVTALYALITTGNFSLVAQKTVQAVSGFGRPTVKLAAKAMNIRGVESEGRTLLLNSDYYNQLGEDPAILSLAAFQRPEIIEQNVLGQVAGFETFEAVNLPTTSNLTGFGLSPSALILAARIPLDYATAQVGSNYGNVATITEPNSGLSMMLTQYVNHDTGTSNYRVSSMFGVAVGDSRRGQLIVSA